MPGDAPAFGLHLLPAAHESVRCAVHAEQIAVDPCGTAFWVDEIVVADLPRPWSKPIWAADAVSAVPEWLAVAGENGRRVRVLAAVPTSGDEHRVVVYERVPGEAEMRRTEHRCLPEEVVPLLGVLLLDGLDASPTTVVDGEAPVRELLICAQGSHDVCCGARGTEFAAEIAAARPRVDVRLVSHTGGHRFAPTGVSLPDGRMWGMIEVEEMLAVIDRTGRPSDVASRCRGWTGTDGPGQVAERAVFAMVDDWTFDETPRTVEVVAVVDEWRCSVRTSLHSWEMHIGRGRVIPEISCGEPGGGVAKPSLEYVVTEPPRVIR